MWNIVLYIVIGYVLLNVLAYFWQEQFLFKPEKLPKDFEFKYPNLNYEEHNVDLGKGVNINGIHFKVENPKGILLYLKGNSKSIKGWGKFAIDFTRQGFDVVMVDYRGFGKSTGKRSEQTLKDDLQFVYDRIKEQVPEQYIVLYGRSMGSGFATKLASKNNPRMLILDAPYYSMKKAANRFLPFMAMSLVLRYPIKTYKWIKYVKCPIKIIHGTNDWLIPFKSSVALSKINPEFTRLYPVIGGGHNNLHTYEEYHRMMEEILKSKMPVQVSKEETSLSFKRKK